MRAALLPTWEDMKHEPVMMQEVLSALQLSPGDNAVDCTAGYGGHSEEILRRILPGGRLVSIDRDSDAIVACKERLRSYGDAVTLVCDNYRNLARIRNRIGLGRVKAVLIDCGVSSPQLDSAERGFSFNAEGPLDMRMDVTQGRDLNNVLHEETESELSDTIFKFGQERFARRIARAIKRNISRIRSTRDLAETIRACVPPPYRHGRLNPATRTFQALRIRVNDELESLQEGIEAGIDALAPGGRIVVISFHSLEDGIAKRAFRAAQQKDLGTIVTKKPLQPTDDESAQNPRARSARLRVFERGGAA